MSQGLWNLQGLLIFAFISVSPFEIFRLCINKEDVSKLS